MIIYIKSYERERDPTLSGVRESASRAVRADGRIGMNSLGSFRLKSYPESSDGRSDRYNETRRVAYIAIGEVRWYSARRPNMGRRFFIIMTEKRNVCYK